MSSGVDSSTSAAILKAQGWDVMGVFLLTQNNTEVIQKNTEDLKNVCKKIDIPFKIIDARKKFKNTVIKYFLQEYKSGRTPNPCVFCNENLKFKILFQEMQKAKADYVATGHYALIRKFKVQSSKLKKNTNYKKPRTKTKTNHIFYIV